ncbi:MAG TPA: NUDIX domain-containing protein [Ramlibacter sp.]|nr:NUDIX domain-containing protein [Ramlibacter sp.]
MLAAHADWLRRLRAGAEVAPLRPRAALWWQAHEIGSVEPGMARQTGAGGLWREAAEGWRIEGGDLTASLEQLAFALRDAGLAHAWRNEQLAVGDAGGGVLGTVERAVVRVLGITTHAVHLAALALDGRHWVQQRALDKPNDPGLWDTLMGGMVPASDSLQQALERETWEEAGLRLAQLRGLQWGGRVSTRRPAGDGQGFGYVVEHIDWYRCELPDGVVPDNQDGEVAQFALLSPQEVVLRLLRDEFTREAALILAQAGL